MKRVMTAIVGIPLVVLITIFAPDRLFAFVVALFAALAVEEFFSLGAAGGVGRPGRWFLAPAALVAAAFNGGTAWVVSALAFSALALLTSAIFSRPIGKALGEMGVGLSGIVYCSITLGFLILLERELVITLFVIVWAGDSAAFYTGRAFGRHSLAPVISPKKTVEGAIGGFAASVLAGIIAAVWFLGESWTSFAWVAAVTAIAGQIGDLAESALKRSAGVKDSSSILPGHGGILDRLDSLFFAAPVFYWFFNS